MPGKQPVQAMSIEEFKANVEKGPDGKLRSKSTVGKSKYSAKHHIYDGIKYDSKLEADRAAYLDVLKDAGKIKGWDRQIRFHLGAVRTYKVDFLIFNNDNTVYVEDAKGAETPRFKETKRFWRAFGLCRLDIIKKKHGRWVVSEVIDGKKSD